MKTYHSKSWSAQARKMADSLITQNTTEEKAVDFLSYSYRTSIIRHRAAKRFGKKMRG